LQRCWRWLPCRGRLGANIFSLLRVIPHPTTRPYFNVNRSAWRLHTKTLHQTAGRGGGEAEGGGFANQAECNGPEFPQQDANVTARNGP
jgi:hypothetical protein